MIINRENVQWLVEDSGIPFDYDMVVIDELSSFKNRQAKRFKSLMKVRPLISRIPERFRRCGYRNWIANYSEFHCFPAGSL